MTDTLKLSQAPVGYSLALEPIYTQATPSLYDVKYDSFTPLTSTPSSNTSINITFNKSIINAQRIDDMCFIFDLSSTDGTNVITVHNIITMLRSIALSVNDGEEIKVNTTIQLRSFNDDYLKDYARSIYAKLQLMRSTEWVDGTFTGITPSSDVTCYVPLFAFFPWLRGLIPSEKGINSMKITVDFNPIPSSAGDAGLICLSSTTSNAYNSSVSFKNCKLLRFCSRINDAALLAQPLDKHLILVNRSDYKLVSAVDWNTVGNEYTFKVSDISKKQNVKSVKYAFYNRSGTSAYNSASCQKLYSGAKYAGFRLREIGGTQDYDLDLRTNQHLMYLYENETQKNRAGNFYLPNTTLTQTNTLSNYFVWGGEIFFDNSLIKEECADIIDGHDSSIRDWEITLYCLATISASCDLYIIVNYYDTYKLDPKERYRMVKVQVPIPNRKLY